MAASSEIEPGIGIDLLEINRLERALERYPRLASRLFTAEELRYSRARRRPGRHLAARFAAKEAVVKALGLRGFGLRDVEVRSGEPPSVRLHGVAARVAAQSGAAIRVSLTHSRDFAAAVALVEAG